MLWSRVIREEEDDYLSDKFLFGPATTPVKPQTYVEKRRQAQKEAQLKNEQNRLKSRRQLEEESREMGLSKSLFERAKEEEAAGLGNKAMSMMMKMGFQPGQSLGRTVEGPSTSAGVSVEVSSTNPDDSGDLGATSEAANYKVQHRVEPLPLNEWTGKKGIGLGKRALSPTAADRIAKAVKLADISDRDTYRDRTRQEYEKRRAEGRLISATRTCVTLDEKAGTSFNVLWLDPHNPESFPQGMMDALEEDISRDRAVSSESTNIRLRRQMKDYALQSLSNDADDLDDPSPSVPASTVDETFSAEMLEEARVFLRLTAQERLEKVLTHLRTRYAYCFWCGTQYGETKAMDEQCPGPDEESHD